MSGGSTRRSGAKSQSQEVPTLSRGDLIPRTHGVGMHPEG